jgi:PLP dependent protein
MIAYNYQQVLARIERAAQSAGRNPDTVRLVVVTKGHPPEVVKAVITAGAKYLGENYVEEAGPKIQEISRQSEVEWHMIGHVQSRKARQVCELFSFVHSLDSYKLAARFSRFAAEFGRVLPVLFECNVSGEGTKFGWPAWVERDWDLLIPEFEQILHLPGLEVCGLMTMAPFASDSEAARPCFRRLRHLSDFLARRFPDVSWGELSMGMSADFEVAIQEGATLVRVGTAILGERP